MGVTKLWDDEDLEKSYKSLREFAGEFYQQHSRAPRVAFDGHILIHQLKTNKDFLNNETTFTKMAVYKLGAFIEVGIEFVMVLDGPKKPAFKRDVLYDFEAMGTQREEFALTNICRKMGIHVVNAAGEGEAECCWLQMEGKVDYVFTGDTDCLLFGATKVLRYRVKNEGGGSEVDEVDEDENSKDEDELGEENAVFQNDDTKGGKKGRLERLATTPSAPSTSSTNGTSAVDRIIEIIHVNENSQFARPQYILRALLQGGDYDHGIKRLGYETAKSICAKRTHLAEELGDIFGWKGDISRSIKDLNFSNEDKLTAWRERLRRELSTNESKFLKRKNSVAIPDTFPSKEIVQNYFHPTIREDELTKDVRVDDPNVADLFDEYRRSYRQTYNNDKLWEHFINNILFAILSLRIRRNEDKEYWYENITEVKSKTRPNLSLYHVKLDTEHLAEILGIRSMNVPKPIFSRNSSTTSSFTNGLERSYSFSDCEYVVTFKSTRKVALPILSLSKHNLLAKFKVKVAKTKISPFTNQEVVDISSVKRKRTNSKRTKSSSISNNHSLSSFFSSSKRDSGPSPKKARIEPVIEPLDSLDLDAFFVTSDEEDTVTPRVGSTETNPIELSP